MDIIGMLGQEAHQKIDVLGYDFLQAQGYKTKYASTNAKDRERLKRKMKRDKFDMFLRYTIKENTILVWFECKKQNKYVGHSKALKFVVRDE